MTTLKEHLTEELGKELAKHISFTSCPINQLAEICAEVATKSIREFQPKFEEATSSEPPISNALYLYYRVAFDIKESNELVDRYMGDK